MREKPRRRECCRLHERDVVETSCRFLLVKGSRDLYVRLDLQMPRTFPLFPTCARLPQHTALPSAFLHKLNRLGSTRFCILLLSLTVAACSVDCIPIIS